MSHDSVKAAFEKQVVLLPLDIIVPQKEVTQSHRSGEFYKQLTASLKHVGVIEPLVVYPRGPGDYLLLDGHVRLEILKSIGVKEVKCLLATDDEAYTITATLTTYPPLRSISCCWRHLKRLTEERIAAALDVSLDSIRAKRDLFKWICSEAVQILRTKQLQPKVFWILAQNEAHRQIEAPSTWWLVEHYRPFAKALLPSPNRKC